MWGGRPRFFFVEKVVFDFQKKVYDLFREVFYACSVSYIYKEKCFVSATLKKKSSSH